jgi:hypothetical protein
VLEDEDADSAALARLAARLEAMEGTRRQAGIDLLKTLEALFND